VKTAMEPLHFTKLAPRNNNPQLVFFFEPSSAFPPLLDRYRLAARITMFCHRRLRRVCVWKMQFLERGKHTVSGKYMIDLHGEHLEGGFSVKERQLKHPARICE